MPTYQAAHISRYTGEVKAFKTFNAEDTSDAQAKLAEMFDAGLPQRHPLEDVDEWFWGVIKKG